MPDRIAELAALFTADEHEAIRKGGRYADGMDRETTKSEVQQRAEKVLGLCVSPTEARAVYDFIRGNLHPEPSLEEAAIQGVEGERRSYHEQGDTATVTLVTAKAIKTLDDLLEACEMDGQVWEVLDWEASAWNAPMRGAEDDINVVQLHRVRARFKRKVFEPALRELAAGLLDDLRGAAARTYDTPPPSGDHLLVLAIPDLHLGKEADGWTLETARDLYLRAVDDLLRKASGFPIGRICLPVGNDAMHTDGSRHTTTKGTIVEYADGWTRQFRAFTALWREAAQRCAAVAPVDLIFIRGNHDHDAVWYAGEVAAALFEGHERIAVRNETAPRVYYRYGKNLLGFAHGDKQKLDDLALTMATEAPQDWSVATCREWHTGHLHKRLVDSVKGVTVRISPALCPADHWHRAMGFVGSLRGAEAVVYHEEAGRVGEFAFAVPETA